MTGSHCYAHPSLTLTNFGCAIKIQGHLMAYKVGISPKINTNCTLMSYTTFTSTGLGHKICQRCKLASPPGTKLVFMASLDPSKPGKDLCTDCYDYYQKKPTTMHAPLGAHAVQGSC